jgi:hypothetical protein
MKKTFLPIAIIALALTAAFMVLRASTPATPKSICKESVDQCPLQKKKNSDRGIMPVDNFSRQFFSFTGSIR